MRRIARKLTADVQFALKNAPVVFVNGPRQAGKTTLVQGLGASEYPADYISFDNPTQMAAAAASPEAFLSSRKGPLIIDEVQLVPEIFRALKIIVDDLRFANEGNVNGRFLLTGSANIMALPKLSDPLVGRMSVKTLLPFAGCEALDCNGNFLDRLFNLDFTDVKAGKTILNDVIRLATFPEISGKQLRVRSEWFDGYLTTMLQRDVRMLSELEKIAVLPTLLRLLAARAGSLMNDASISRDAGLNPVTSKSYRAILQAMFLTFDVQPWYRNIGKRLVKSPKGYLTDTLLLCHMLEWNLDDLRDRRPDVYGHVVENFVATELTKLLTFSNLRARLLHFRTSDNKEVDFVLERPDGRLTGIEVKSSDTVKSADFKGMKVLLEAADNDFVGGVVLYTGKDVVPFGEKLLAVPVGALWE